MGTESLFHPDHIVPASLFIAGGGKVGYSLVAEKFMKGNAGGIRVGNAGAEIADVLPAEDVLQRQIKLFSDSLFPKALLYVNRGFHRPVVGSPALKGGNIGISQSFSIFLCHKVGVFF